MIGFGLQAPRLLCALGLATAGLLNAAGSRAPLPRTGAASAQEAVWTPIGPAPTASYAGCNPDSSGGTGTCVPAKGPTSGRVTALAYDRAGGILYAGGEDGGVWKTADNGGTWTPLTDGAASLAIGALALDPANPRVIYAGTGEANNGNDALFSAGILKSADGGTTWRLLGGASGDAGFAGRHAGGHSGLHIGTIVVDPGNSSHLLVATDRGLYRSTDGGAGWRRVFGDDHTDFTDLLATPGSGFLAAEGAFRGAGGNGLYRSADGGATWTSAPAPGTGNRIGRITLARAPSNPAIIYLLASNPGLAGDLDSGGAGLANRSLGVWRSDDSGRTWRRVVEPYTGTSAGGPDLLGRQGYYNQALAVDPGTADRFYVAGVNPYVCVMVTAGGDRARCARMTGTPAPHPDQHALLCDQPGHCFLGNDGGVYAFVSRTGRATVFQDLNGNLALTEFYAGSTTRDFAALPVIYGGTQDNGTQRYTGNPVWSQVYGGDGGYTATNPNNPEIAYLEYAHLDIHKTTDGGRTWVRATNGIDRGPNNTLFIAPMMLDPAQPDRLIAGTDRVYETTSGAAPASGSPAWHSIGRPLHREQGGGAAVRGDRLSALAIAGPRRIYAGSQAGGIWTGVRQAGGWAWSRDISPLADRGLPAGVRSVTSLAAYPGDARDVVATFNGFASADAPGIPPATSADYTSPGTHVYRRRNGVWQDVSRRLPDLPANSVVRDPTNPDWYYLGTDAGVFATFDNGASWTRVQCGMPNVAITQLFTDGKRTWLIAATHGRGMYTIALAALQTRPGAAPPSTPSCGTSIG